MTAGQRGCRLRALLALAVATTAPAAEQDIDIWSLDLDELLDVKVKVASRAEETVARAPSSVTVFTRTAIGNMGLRSLEELLNYVPGFASERTEFIGQQWALSTRGFWGVSDPAVLLLIDGLRLNEHFSGSFGLLERLIALDAVERIEVIRGPGSALYGSNAFYGVINIVTVKERNELRVEAGSFGSQDYAANVSHRFGKSLVSATLRTFSDDGESYAGIYDPAGLTDRTQDPREGRDAYVSFERGGFRINLRHQARNFADFYLLGQVANDLMRFHAEGTGLFSSYRFEGGGGFRAELSGFVNVYESEGFGRFATKGTGPFDEADLFIGVYHTTRVANLSLDMASDLGEKSTLSYGIGYELADNPQAYQASNYDILDYETYLGSIVPQREPEKRFVTDDARGIAGLYVQEKYQPTDRLTLIGGLRYDHYNDFGGTANPRAAVIFEAGGGATLKAMYGEAFVAPSMEKLYLGNNPFEVANPDLEPQEIRTVEVAYLQQLDHLQTTLTLYHNKETDLFSLRQFPDESFRTVNAGENTSKGFEVELATDAGEHVLLRATYSQVLDGERPEAPRRLASLIANLRLGPANVNLNGYYHGPTSVLPGEGGHVIINLAAGWEIREGLGVHALAKNVLDEDDVTYTRIGNHELPNRGRQLLLGLRYAF